MRWWNTWRLASKTAEQDVACCSRAHTRPPSPEPRLPPRMCRARLLASRVLKVPGAVRPSPSLFHYPGLTARPWHERTSPWVAPWVGALEAAAPAITREYLALREGGALPPSDYEAEASDHGGALHTGDAEWHWASLIDRGRRRDGMWARCPETAEALSAVPGLCVGTMPFAFAFFSTLAPGSRIAPHTSPANLRVRVHLPLIVPEPEACGIVVGGEARRWEEGKALVFDDAFEHSVWNDGAAERVVLLFDLWHWELAPAEIESIEGMFGEVEAMQQARGAL